MLKFRKDRVPVSDADASQRTGLSPEMSVMSWKVAHFEIAGETNRHQGAEPCGPGFFNEIKTPPK